MECKSLDFENFSAPVTQSGLKEMPLEVMILKQKVEELGLKFEYLHDECLICIQDGSLKSSGHYFKWYNNTNDDDLYNYFEEIFQSIRHLVGSQSVGF